MLSISSACHFLSNYRLGALGQRAVDFWSVSKLAPVEIFIMCEGGEDATLLAGNSLVASPEVEDKHRRVWSNRSIGGLVHLGRQGLDQILNTDPERPIYILAYSATSEWEHFVAESSIPCKLVAPPALLKDALDNKIHVRSQLSKLGLPVPQSVAVESSQLDYWLLANALGKSLIAQRPVGSAGIGTFEIHSDDELRRLREETSSDKWLISAYEGPATLNIHGLALPEGVQVSVPSVQLTGIPDLSMNKCGYCGNDFGAAEQLPPPVLEDVRHLAAKVGEWLLTQDYYGIYGVDLVVKGNTVRILEVNPRLQGSTWLLAELEFESGAVPMVIKHFLQWFGHEVDINNAPIRLGKAAQAIIHCADKKPVRINHQLRPGVYTLSECGQLIRQRVAFDLLGLGDQEFLLFGMPPCSESIVEPDAVLARLATRSRLAAPDGRSLTGFGRQIVRAVTQELMATPFYN